MASASLSLATWSVFLTMQEDGLWVISGWNRPILEAEKHI